MYKAQFLCTSNAKAHACQNSRDSISEQHAAKLFGVGQSCQQGRLQSGLDKALGVTEGNPYFSRTKNTS
jgi:hypothetical protein